MLAAQPSGTVTLVVTDIEGSTRLLDELGVDGYREALTEHRRIVREACSRHGGYEVDYEGDAFTYAFFTAQAAVRAVGEAMRGLDGGPIKLRIGVHTGEPALDPPRYVGMDVHRGERIMSAAHGGQIVLSRETARLLDADHLLKDLGEHRFHGLAAPERVYQLGSGDHPPLRSLYRPRLPIPGTPFLGRKDELTQVVERLTHPDTRLLTLTGPGGAGKTRLALQAAATAADLYPDGVTWIALAPLRDPALFLPTVAQALEIRDEPGTPLTETVAEGLLGKQTLVLLDNAEHLLPEAAHALAGLTSACPTLRLLATSRERLRISAEITWSVPPLADRDGEDLFLARARGHGAAVDADEHVGALCRRLDGLPLAIELAAARTPELSPGAILERLEGRLDLLSTRARDVDERQRTLEATIDWSYDLLDVEERRALRALSVFAGGCTPDAAAHVALTNMQLLESLCDKSLVRRRVDDAGSDRFSMLETVREYAARRLEEVGERSAMLRVHARFFAGQLAELWRGARAYDERASRLLEADVANGRLALDTTLDDGDGGTSARLLWGLGTFWTRYGLLREALAAVERWLLLDRSALAPAERLIGEMVAAEILRMAGETERARDMFHSAIDLTRRHPEAEIPGSDAAARHWILPLLAELSRAELRLGDIEDARHHAEESLELYRAWDEPLGIANALAAVASIARRAGDLERSAACWAEAAEVAATAHRPTSAALRVRQAEVEIVRNRLSGALDLLAGNLADVSVDQDTDDLVRSLLVAAGALAACGARAEATAVARAASAQAATSGIGLDQWEQDALAKLVALGRTNGNGAADPSPLLEAGEALGLALETVKELVERR
jgi:predicted ATPase/class 3 adenylate cyclase